jgi:ribosomal protein L28
MISAPHRVWLLGQAVAKQTPLADPRRWGGLPYELQKYRQMMPVLMHGKTITFANIQTKHSHSRRSFIPNIIYRPLYSKALDMQVWSCLSAQALREIDAWGGFDEYILGVSPEKLGTDKMTRMYKKKISEARISSKGTFKDAEARMMNLLKERYGQEYIHKVNQLLIVKDNL